MFKTFLAAFFSLTIILLLPNSLYAAEGIGFAQAEEGTWYCTGDNPVNTLNCAREKCKAEADGQGCYRTRWCYGGGWSGLMTVFLSDFHVTEIICGAPSQEALKAALVAFCNGNEYATECSISLTIDPTGKEQEVLGADMPGPAGNQ